MWPSYAHMCAVNNDNWLNMKSAYCPLGICIATYPEVSIVSYHQIPWTWPGFRKGAASFVGMSGSGRSKVPLALWYQEDLQTHCLHSGWSLWVWDEDEAPWSVEVYLYCFPIVYVVHTKVKYGRIRKPSHGGWLSSISFKTASLCIKDSRLPTEAIRALHQNPKAFIYSILPKAPRSIFTLHGCHRLGHMASVAKNFSLGQNLLCSLRMHLSW